MAKGFGKPKYGGNGFGNQRKPVEGDNLIRVLPPMHSFADEGKWTNYVGIHFGDEGVDPSDKSKTKQRPYRCIQEKQRNGLVTAPCPKCDKIERTEAEMKEKEAELIRASTSADKIETELAPYKAWLKAHNVDRKHYLNVFYADGECGWFTLSHRTKKQHLDVKIEEVRDEYHIDPMDPAEGCWFNVKRVGKGISVTESVEIVMEDVEVGGRKLKDIKRAPLTEDQCTKALAECRDLATVGTLLTFEQIKAIAEGSGDPEEVDAIFAQNAPAAESTPAPKAESKPAPKAPPESKPAPAPKAQDPAVAARLAQIAAKRAAEAEAARVAEEAAKAAAAAAAAESPPVDESALSDEEFMKRFGGA